MIDKVKMICEQYHEPRRVVRDSFLETPINFGIKQQNARIYATADYALQMHSGDILQIGCGKGRVTAILAEVAARYDRQVTCIDPYNTGKTTSGNEKLTDKYFQFLKNTKPYGDTVHLHLENSSTEMSDALIQLIEYSFVYIDGKSSYDVHANDIYLASRKNAKSGIICLDHVLSDDGKKKPESMMSLYENMIGEHGFGYYWNQGQREGYLLT